IMIDLSINCAGEIYGHDIVNDAIYTINRSSGAATFVGSTGLAANYAQGMDFDNDSGTLYIYALTEDGTSISSIYGTVNLNTGTVTPLFVDNPLGEYEGATKTVCGSGWTTLVMVPTLLNNVCSGFNGPWEVESNNSPAQSNGYLCFGRNYSGNANADGGGLMNDYFHFDLPQGRTVVIDVSNFLPIAQVQLIYHTDTSNPVVFIGDQSSGSYRLTYSGPAGKYYIRLVSPQPQAQTYTLRVQLQ
ncbi:MAG: hypothetical protein WA996_15630, partial [Candidatus Promineifilaceae bacterium]